MLLQPTYPCDLSTDTLRSRTYSGEGAEESVRLGFNPDEPEAHNPEQVHNLDYPFTAEEGKEEQKKKDIKPPVSEEAGRWETEGPDRRIGWRWR